jgi:SAM-dependent methyltransferase
MKFRGYRVHVERVTIAGGAYELLAPDRPERLLDDPRVRARFEADEYLPYWGTVWPAALTLAEVVAGWGPAGVSSPTVLELGCGLGLVGAVAARLGYSVVGSDYDEDALAFARANAERNGATTLRVRSIDWRQTYADLRPERIVGADVLYERRNLEPVVGFTARHLAPGGFALLSDPWRGTADPFPEVARAAGFRIDVEQRERGRVWRLDRHG